ncbi:MFS transporter [Ferviditalea candida]|uniref:MFS transporter n=1 Tax=Ferviditalea candida TaxID=3108399 RepID=A0ABU5ZME6_9BACL|nr:MFS transporter [Paenibacillaceae bacterium T2]
MNKNILKTWDASYEWKAVTLLTIGFGLVGLDRWIIAPLFPVMMKDLNLGYADLGNIVAALGIAWGIFAIIMGGLSDKFGRRRIMIPAMVVFSALCGLTGVASGLMSLLFVRALMGVFEGAFCPTSIASTSEASKPSRRGFNMGLQQSTFALFGLGFGPIIATQLLNVVPSWHWVFFLVAVPGLIIAYLLFRVIREPVHIEQKTERKSWLELLLYRNVILATFGLFGTMTGVFVISAMLPNYLTDYLKLSIPEMGFVTSAIGFGGFVGYIAIPALSDRLGRKTVSIISFILAIVFLYLFKGVGNSPMLLFLLLFMATLFIFGCLCLLAGPIVTEAVPASLISSAAGIPIGFGEIFGGGVMPSVAGYVAQNFGIDKILFLAIGGLVVALIISFFLHETAPVKIKITKEAAEVG